MSEIPWWGLPLIAALFALAGAVAARFLTARHDFGRGDHRRNRRWYEERKAAYVRLLAIFERVTYQLRAADIAGEKPAPVRAYVDEVSPALMEVRLLASGPVRSAALAVHVLLQQLHKDMNPSAVPGVQPQIHFRELLTQVPLVMQHFEAAIREELHISDTPPIHLDERDGDLRGRTRSLRRRSRRPALKDLADIGQDLSRDR